jgi:hypothetical protein
MIVGKGKGAVKPEAKVRVAMMRREDWRAVANEIHPRTRRMDDCGGVVVERER